MKRSHDLGIFIKVIPISAETVFMLFKQDDGSVYGTNYRRHRQKGCHFKYDFHVNFVA